MLTVIIVTIAIVAPLAAMRLATSHNNSLEWLFWVVIIVATGSHIETWRLVNSTSLTFGVVTFGFFFAVYEVMAAPVLFVLVLENKRGKNNN